MLIKFMESTQVAQLAGVTPGAIRKAVARGDLEPVAETARGSLFTVETVQQWMARRRRGSARA